MIKEGTEVKWKWGNGEARGKVIATFPMEIEKQIEGTTIKRIGEPGNKALYIDAGEGKKALKLESEVQRAE